MNIFQTFLFDSHKGLIQTEMGKEWLLMGLKQLKMNCN